MRAITVNRKPTTIDCDLTAVPEDLRAKIRSIVPDAEECISDRIPAFRLDWAVVAVTADAWRAYRDEYSDMRGFSRFYFATHSPAQSLPAEANASDHGSFILWGAEKLAEQATRGGLIGWLINKAG